MTDGGFVIEPSLEDKIHLIENAVKIAQACGIEKPKVAPLCAVDVVNPKMRCTVEGKKLTEMNGKSRSVSFLRVTMSGTLRQLVLMILILQDSRQEGSQFFL